MYGSFLGTGTAFKEITLGNQWPWFNSRQFAQWWPGGWHLKPGSGGTDDAGTCREGELCATGCFWAGPTARCLLGTSFRFCETGVAGNMHEKLLFAFGVNISVARRLTACQIGKLDETANHTTGLTNQNKLPPLTQGQAITTLDT